MLKTSKPVVSLPFSTKLSSINFNFGKFVSDFSIRNIYQKKKFKNGEVFKNINCKYFFKIKNTGIID